MVFCVRSYGGVALAVVVWLLNKGVFLDCACGEAKIERASWRSNMLKLIAKRVAAPRVPLTRFDKGLLPIQ